MVTQKPPLDCVTRSRYRGESLIAFVNINYYIDIGSKRNNNEKNVLYGTEKKSQLSMTAEDTIDERAPYINENREVNFRLKLRL